LTPATPTPSRGRNLPAAFGPGDLVGERYRIVRLIAEGGMGEVYEAEDLALHGHVALKTIHPEIAEDAQALERFRREIHVARRVTHPNVCRIYDLGTHRVAGAGEGAAPAEVLFLTMELLLGETLSQRIARAGRLGTEEALPIVVQIVAGLEAAHSAGVIHRDFKSANVVLVKDSREGVRAVITDFGLARATVSDRSLMSISDSGAVVGTPAYMAPEQVKGQPLTPAADIYALGVVLYEMTTGLRPFDGGSAISVAVKRLSEDPKPPRAHVPELDPVWNAVILRCLERQPAARCASARGVAEALAGRARRSGSLSLATATLLAAWRRAVRSPRLHGARSSTGAVLLALAAAALAGYGWWRGKAASSGGAGPTVAAAVLRPSVAVLALRNSSGRDDASWLSTALAEMLTADLAAGGKLRAVPGEEVARITRDIGLASLGDPAALAKLRQNLGADFVVEGEYTSPAAGLVRVDLRLLEARTGVLAASAGASGVETQVFDLVSRAAKPLRERLGLGDVEPARALEVAASLPSDPAATSFYSEGLARLRLSDARGARRLLEQAVAAEPGHPLPHAALAEALLAMGYEAEARGEAEQASASAGRLSLPDRLVMEARLARIEGDWDRSIERYRALFDASPDELDHGLGLAEAQTSAGRAREALVTIERLRALPEALSEDPRIDLAEARARQELSDVRRQQALAATAAGKARARGARLLLARARLLEAGARETLGDREAAAAAVEEARGLYEAAGDRAGMALAVHRMALALDARGDKAGARRLFERSLAINREIGNRAAVARDLLNLGTVLFETGKVEEAHRLYEEALATFRQLGAKYLVASALNDIGARLHTSGDLAGAQKHYQEALAAFSGIGERSGVATTLTNLAELLFVRGELKQAQEMHEESLAINREIGDKAGQAYDLYRLGELHRARGDLRVAQGRYEEALKLQRELGDDVAAAQTRLGLALLAEAQERPAEAESLAREAEEVLRAGGSADLAALAQIALVGSLLAQGRRDEARKASAPAEEAAGKSENQHVKLAAAAMTARLRAASGAPRDVAAALRALDSVRAEAVRAGFVKEQLEASLELGELEIRSGRAAAGRARLRTLAREAQAKGLGLVARRAERALGAGAR
jgi:tetratricopeptide (TPR) repeat protein